MCKSVINYVHSATTRSMTVVSVIRLLPSRRYASADTSYGPLSSLSVCSVYVLVCLSQVDVLSKQLNELGCFLAWQLHSTYPRKFRYLKN